MQKQDGLDKIESLEELWGKFARPEHEYVGSRESTIQAALDALPAKLNSCQKAPRSEPQLWEPFLAATANFPRASKGPVNWAKRFRKRSQVKFELDDEVNSLRGIFIEYLKKRYVLYERFSL